jgi:hypothetical protein
MTRRVVLEIAANTKDEGSVCPVGDFGMDQAAGKWKGDMSCLPRQRVVAGTAITVDDSVYAQDERVTVTRTTG